VFTLEHSYLQRALNRSHFIIEGWLRIKDKTSASSRQPRSCRLDHVNRSHWRRSCSIEDVSDAGAKLTVEGTLDALHLKEFFRCRRQVSPTVEVN
jgi:hypothetical protein